MYQAEIEKISASSQSKSAFLRRSKDKYIISSALAGMYVGFGILHIFTIGGLLNQAGSVVVRLIMGISFGIALSLVIMAGSELFTGNNMVMAIGRLNNRVTGRDVILVHLFSFVGNLIGSIFVAGLFVYSGLGVGSTASFIIKTAQLKMSLPWVELLTRGIFCNALVCLAIWCSFRMKEETGKLIMIFWCLFAFITTGFEHSIANMTILSTALLISSSEVITIFGFIYNIVWVTLGNIIGGSVVIGFSYWYISKKD